MNWPKNNDILGFFLLFLAFINGLCKYFGIFWLGDSFGYSSKIGQFFPTIWSHWTGKRIGSKHSSFFVYSVSDELKKVLKR
jgi:hypothetical protein